MILTKKIVKGMALVVLLCIVLCCSCKSQSDNTFTYIGDVNFPVGFTANDRCSGLFYQDNEPYYYFGELTSRKIIGSSDISSDTAVMQCIQS